MTIINEDWQHVLQHEAMYSIEEQMSKEEEYWQYETNLEQLPALIEVVQINTPIYEYSRSK